MTKEHSYIFSGERGNQNTIVVVTDDNEKVVSFNIFQGDTELSLSEIGDIFLYRKSLLNLPGIFDTIETPLDSAMYDGEAFMVHVLYKPTNQLIGVSGEYSSYSGTEVIAKFVSEYEAKTIYQIKNEVEF